MVPWTAPLWGCPNNWPPLIGDLSIGESPIGDAPTGDTHLLAMVLISTYIKKGTSWRRSFRDDDDDVDNDDGNIIKYESQFMTSQKILVGISMGEKTNKCDDHISIHSLIIDEFIH